jgi:hypothetical protein
MSKLPSHVEGEPQTFFELLCFSAIVFRSKVPKESILVKDELLNRMKKEIIDLPNKGKDEPKSYKIN